MKNGQSTQEMQSSTQVSHESQGEQKNNQSLEAPIQDSGSVSASSNDGRKVSRQDIELVQNLIERCLQLYMNRDEVVKTLLTRARIDPGFTTLVWQKLEEENADFFRAYYIRLKLKKQIIVFNHLLEHQYHLMKYPVHPKVPLVPMQNGIHPMAPVNNMPMGYPVLQHPQMHVRETLSLQKYHSSFFFFSLLLFKREIKKAMDGYEATRIVLSRIQALDPENASKIMGLLLLQDHGEKEMIRLAFGPETLVHSVIAKAKKELGLMSCSRPSWSQEELISPRNNNNNRGSSLNPASLPFYANGGRSSKNLTNEFEFMDDVNPRSDFLGSMHARSGSCVLDGLGYGDSDLGFGGVPCSYYARGFCKNGSSCRFVHSDGGAELVASPSRIELLRSNSVPPRLAHHFMTRSFSPKGVNLQSSDAQRAAAALMMGDDFQKLGRWRPERIDLSAMACPASRQIYLTFPADSRFREEDVSNYFSTFGPVQDVRIPYQQKRMFGFVTFVYPETVKSILAKGNPHFVCDSRVLVKPYKEKGKVPDKYRTNQPTELELSPTGLSSSPRDAIGGRGFYNNAQDVLWESKFEEEILELQSRRLMNMQLHDVKKHFQLNSPTQIHSPNPFSQALLSPRSLPVKAGREIGKGSSKEGSDDDTMNLPERLEDSLPDSPFASSTHHLVMFGESTDNSGSDLWSPSSDNDDNSTPSTLSDSNSFNCQMPRLLPIGMLPGRGGPACRVGI